MEGNLYACETFQSPYLNRRNRSRPVNLLDVVKLSTLYSYFMAPASLYLVAGWTEGLRVNQMTDTCCQRPQRHTEHEITSHLLTGQGILCCADYLQGSVCKADFISPNKLVLTKKESLLLVWNVRKYNFSWQITIVRAQVNGRRLLIIFARPFISVSSHITWK